MKIEPMDDARRAEIKRRFEQMEALKLRNETIRRKEVIKAIKSVLTDERIREHLDHDVLPIQQLPLAIDRSFIFNNGRIMSVQPHGGLLVVVDDMPGIRRNSFDGAIFNFKDPSDATSPLVCTESTSRKIVVGAPILQIFRLPQFQSVTAASIRSTAFEQLEAQQQVRRMLNPEGNRLRR